MGNPEAVRKHDGRVVAYDSSRVSGSITRAAIDAAIAPDAARRVAHEISEAVGTFLLGEGRSVPASADVRAFTVKLLRQTGHDKIADAYSEHSRVASGLLWRIRVVDPGTPFTSSAGSPWDRRRLLESLRLSGIARDPAGEVAREVERRIVALSQERISPALIHALTTMVLSQRAMDVRVYAARRVAFSMAVQTPRYDPASADQTPLPYSGPALESFWLQAVHSPEIVRAVRDNILSLEPYPARPLDYPAAAPLSADALTSSSGVRNATGGSGTSCIDPLDPLQPVMSAAVREWCAQPGQALWLKADVPERAGEIARYIAMLPASLVPDVSSGAAINILLHAPKISPQPVERGAVRARSVHQAPPVTINLAGLMVREALRDQTRATVRLAQTASLAAQAHREREEYFNLSPVRGRQLPIAVAGLWNAAAWLQGENFDSRHITRNSRTLAATLLSIARGAVETLRNETGMELALVASAPLEATRELWRRDREFFLRDGVTLDASAMYEGGSAVKLFQGVADFADRLDFAKAVSSVFDEPPAMIVEAPLGSEPDGAVWRELFAAFALAGVPRLTLIPGGGVRGLKTLSRAVRSHVEGLPLFEQISGS